MSTSQRTITSEGEPDEQFDDIGQQRHANLMGMWIFLATELLLFGGMFTGFVVYRSQYPAAFGEAAHHLDLTLGAINTAVLLTSGLTTRLADVSAEAGRRFAAFWLLLATVALGAVFLVLKGFEWYHEYEHGLMPVLGVAFEYPGEHARGAHMFFNFYYAMTGLHAAHMLVGLGLLTVIAGLVWRWREPARVARQVQISGLYWAFVDVIWVFVFTALYLLRA